MVLDWRGEGSERERKEGEATAGSGRIGDEEKRWRRKGATWRGRGGRKGAKG
jgi:hypothetical protein